MKIQKVSTYLFQYNICEQIVLVNIKKDNNYILDLYKVWHTKLIKQHQSDVSNTFM